MTQQPATVSAEELVRALKRRKAALPAEIGSFVVLEACEALLRGAPARISPAHILISEEGAIQLAGAERCAELEATQTLHQMLAFMLVAAGPAPLPALMRLLEKGPSRGVWTLAALRDDLEASLVPLNRNASRRVLARFVREIGWAERAPAKKPTFQDLDSELSSFLSDEPPRPRAPLMIEPEPELAQDDTHEDLAEEIEDARDQVQFFESVRPAAPRVSAGKTLVDVVPSGARTGPSAEDISRELAHEPSARQSRAPSLRPMPRSMRPFSEIPRPPRSPALIWGGVLLALSLAVVIATVQLRPELLTRLTEGDPEPPASKEPKVVVKRPAAGDLVVRVGTERAQILRFVGRGPASVPHLPLGIAHEFVGIADGASPARLLVPKDAEWEGTPDGPRYEAAMQLGSANQGLGLELGETLLPQDVGTPSEKLGTVRIVTTPRGAKVYQVIGFAPEARVEALPLESTQELMIYKKGFAPELRVVAPSDYVERGDKKVAELDITLAPLAKPKR